ncbi:hypothetical protein BH11BAC2_BH11BAC2_25680 [soil metagenome]
MKKIMLLCLIISIAGINSCKKDSDSASSNNCSLPNGFLRCTAGSADFCADQTLFADYAIVMTINGIAGNGSTLTLELDDVTTGTYQMKELTNHLLYTSPLGDSFETTDDNPGTLVITSNNTATNTIEGTYTSTVRSPLSGNLNLTKGMFKVFYTE